MMGYNIIHVLIVISYMKPPEGVFVMFVGGDIDSAAGHS